MIMYYFNTSIFILISCLVLLWFGNCFAEDGDVQAGVTHICVRNAACKYVICLWGRRERGMCNLVPFLLDSNCVCSPTKICSLTDEVSDDGSPLSYHYRCRDPRRVLPYMVHKN